MTSSPQQDPSRYRESARERTDEADYRREMEQYIAESDGSWFEKLEHFPRFTSRQALTRFLALYEIFREILPVHGDIVQGGVNVGGSLFGFAQMSAILEPNNLQRRIIGFDTFSGFPALTEADKNTAGDNAQMREGGYDTGEAMLDSLKRGAELFDANRFIGHVPKIELVKGDACETIPAWLEQNPHTIIALLHLDFDVYAPTKAALETLLPRMPGGAVIIFDELNHPNWPGETVAIAEAVGIPNLQIRRHPFEPFVSYAIL